MSKIKILSLFFVFVLLLGALASCGEDPYYKFSRDLEPLTDEQIEECNAAYREDYFGTYEEFCASKSDDVLEQAERIYYGMKLVQNNVYTPYLGIFSGAIVCGNALNMDQELYLIDGKPVKMGVINKITVYKDGKFASISQAYNSGWITKEDVTAIEARIEQYSAAMEK